MEELIMSQIVVREVILDLCSHSIEIRLICFHFTINFLYSKY